MDSNEQTVQKHVVVNTPDQRSEVLTERTQRGPRESGLSTGTIAIIAILAITAIAAIFYIVSNRNANESANRNANLEVASQANSDQVPPTTIIQQPAQQAPVIIQQPAQPAPVIIQQPSLRDNASDDANMQEVATKRLGEETDMNAVSITITDSQAVLTGTVYSAATKARAEQIVKGVRGVKSVDNQIVVSG
ncbi:MAG TPA: BON domain-containing protein [Anaerolineales bacterium]|nr:BON domain-containing protein [Anaerolineales bacterium]